MYKHKFLLQLHLNVATMYINLTICVCRVWVCDNVIDNCTSTSPYFLMLGVIFPRTSLHRLIMFVRLVQLLKDIITWNDELALPTFIYLRNKKCIWIFYCIWLVTVHRAQQTEAPTMLPQVTDKGCPLHKIYQIIIEKAGAWSQVGPCLGSTTFPSR